jgi:hypothetical protein
MKPVKQRLGAILRDPGQITVPMYQRQYSWEEEDVKIFWNDLVALSFEENADSTHYLGTMVTQKGESLDGGVESCTIIDGQQRITVLMLLAAAMRDAVRFDPCLPDFIRQSSVEAENRRRADRQLKQLHLDLLLDDVYLHYEIEENKYRKFLPTELNFDRDVFNSVVYEGKADGRKRHHRHYVVLKDLVIAHAGIGKAEVTKEDAIKRLHLLLDALFRVELVYIELGQNDDPQQIFESINHKGVDLSVTDLIRNHVLSIGGEVGKLQMYESVWKPVENSLCMMRMKNEGVLRKALFDGFFRSYLGMDGKVVPGKKLFSELREVLAAKILDTDDVPARVVKLTSFSSYAESYEALSYPACDRSSPELKKHVERFSRLDFSVPMSLVLKFYGERNHPADALIGQTFHILENYFVRRSLLGRTVKDMAELFASLSKAYDRSALDHEKFPQWLTDNLIRETESNFKELGPVSDATLQEEIKRARVYANSRNATRFALSQLEVKRSNGVIVQGLHEMDIEHVLPQEHTTHWMKDLIKWHSSLEGFPADQDPAVRKKNAENWVNDRVDLLRDSLGNLTLTSFNRSLGHRSFLDKRDYEKNEKEKGYAKCNIRLTREDFGTLQNWTFPMIEARSVSLAGELCVLYPELRKSDLPG